MRRISRFAVLPILAMVFLMASTGCHKSQDQTAANADGTQNPSTDPAAANLAPADSSTSQPATSTSAPASSSASSSAAAPSSSRQSAPQQDTGSYQDSGQYSDDPGYGVQPVAYATQAPPPLPTYDQPQAPGDGYLWTPGYWAWSGGGYYWVPGAWVEAPYEGALWTPGYWGWGHNRYQFYRGYWGRHIGYYGGINYGFGYIGFGYQGGYWDNDHFRYNRAVNNVDIRVVRNVYSYNVGDNRSNGIRVSFNGGSGGVQMRARPQELRALHEQHAAPMSTQIQHEQAARSDRAQFAGANQGRPANMVANRPLQADRNVKAPAAMQGRNQVGGQQMQQQQQQRQTMPGQQHQMPQQQQRQTAPQQQHQAAPQQQHQAAPQHQDEHPK